MISKQHKKVKVFLMNFDAVIEQSNIDKRKLNKKVRIAVISSVTTLLVAAIIALTIVIYDMQCHMYVMKGVCQQYCSTPYAYPENGHECSSTCQFFVNVSGRYC